jgi:hypothetical protein
LSGLKQRDERLQACASAAESPIYKKSRINTEEALVADVDVVGRALASAIEKRMLEGCGKLNGVTTVDGVVQVTFTGVTDEANVFDTLSGALLDVRLQLEAQPDLDVKIRRK